MRCAVLRIPQISLPRRKGARLPIKDYWGLLEPTGVCYGLAWSLPSVGPGSFGV